ncbi:hypothetical protein DdX_02866 [Ditylenchus destructor]|uniref:CCHC-type domain-containing protein n=1 Tax=Ditylenchus destructor TaxID=166010 RepID=A0AAD4RCJ7_9BILA|nr:hypothetical protein DdX_02866 [Ditylenchus destructor]
MSLRSLLVLRNSLYRSSRLFSELNVETRPEAKKINKQPGNSAKPKKREEPDILNQSIYSLPRIIEHHEVCIKSGTRNCFHVGNCKNPMVCLKCGSHQHSLDECPQRKCALCGENGHIFSQCKNWNNNVTRIIRGLKGLDKEMLCANCDAVGHEFHQCPEITCQKCGTPGHIHSFCERVTKASLAETDASSEKPIKLGDILNNPQLIKEATILNEVKQAKISSGYGRRRRHPCACVPTIVSGAGANSYSNSALPPAPFPLAMLPKMLSGSGSLPPASPTPLNLATAPASESDTLSSNVSHDPAGSAPSGTGSQKSSDNEGSGCHCCDCGCCDCGCCGCCGGWGCRGRMNVPHSSPNPGSITSSSASMDTASPLTHQNDAAPAEHINQPNTSTDTITEAKTKVVRRMAYHRLNSKPPSKHHHHSTRHNHTKHRKPPHIVHKVVIKDSHCKCR